MRGKPVRPEPEESIPATSKEKKPLSPLEAKLARINSQRKLNAGCHIMSDTPTASTVPQSMPCNDPQSRPESTTPSLSTPSSTPGATESLPASSAAETSSTGKPSEPPAPTSGEATNAAPHALREHAKHSPSSHKPKSICPGFRNEDTDEWKKFSDRGEAGHEALEKEDLSLCKDDIDLRNAVSKCLAYIKQFPGKPHRELKIKTLYEWGFVDRVHIGEHAHLFDPKFVLNRYYANSAQFWDYAIGVFKKFPEVQKITVHVLMPFLDLIDTETWTRQEDLPVLVQRVATIVAQAVADDPSSTG